MTDSPSFKNVENLLDAIYVNSIMLAQVKKERGSDDPGFKLLKERNQELTTQLEDQTSTMTSEEIADLFQELFE